MKHDGPRSPGERRRQAEERLSEEQEDQREGVGGQHLLEDAARVIHELRVRQIELELQNDELRRAQAETLAGQAHYVDLYDLAPVGYVTVGGNGLILEANVTSAALLGASRDRLVPQPLTTFILNEDQGPYSQFQRKLSEASSAGAGRAVVPQTCELRMVKPGGAIFWARLDATATQDPDGAPVYRVALSDVTDRKQAEEALRQSQERFRIAQEASTDGFTILRPVRDAHDRIVDFTWVYENPAIARLNGTDPEQVVGRRLLELFPDHRGTPILQAYREVAESGEPQTIESKYASESMAKPTWFRIVVVPMAGDIAILAQDVTEREELNEALAESEKKFRALFETMSEGVVYEAHDGTIISANPAAERLLGLSLDQMQGRTSLDPRWKVIHEDGSPFPGEMHSLFVAATTGKPGYDEIMGIYNPSLDAYVWLSVNSTPEFLPGETVPFRAYAVFRDITERKRMEGELRRAFEDLDHEKQLIDAIFNSMPGIFYTLDVTGRFVRWNPNLERVTGHGRDELAAMRALELFEGAHQQRVSDAMQEVAEQGEATVEAEILTKSGSGAPYLLTGVRAQIGGAPHLVGMGIDITDRKRTEEELRHHRNHLGRLVEEKTAEIRAANAYNRGLIEASIDPFIMIGKDGTITDVNDAVVVITGTPRDGLIGSYFPACFTDPARAKAGLDQVFRGGEVRNYELRLRRTDGHPTPVRISASVYRDEADEVAGVFAVARDIAELKLAEERILTLNGDLVRRTAELESVNHELEAFSYSVSHDLKAPLRAVDGFTQMLEEDYAASLDDEGRRLLKVVRDSTHDMGQLINDLLMFSRLSRKDLTVARLDLGRMVEEARRLVEPSGAERTLQWDIGDLPDAFGDEATIREVLVNLIANAVKFTRPRQHGVIGIAGDAGDGDVVYSVRDNGVGFDMAYKDKLFRVFQRLHTSDEFEGTGIGLALVQRIIQRHGGRVWGEGKVNEGATFYFTLPTESTNADVAVREPATSRERAE